MPFEITFVRAVLIFLLFWEFTLSIICGFTKDDYSGGFSLWFFGFYCVFLFFAQ